MTITIWDILTFMLLRPIAAICVFIAVCIALFLIIIIISAALGIWRAIKQTLWPDPADLAAWLNTEEDKTK